MTGGVTASGPNRFISCFPVDTLVATEHGLRPIQFVKPLDKVWSFNFSQGKWQLQYVQETFERAYSGSFVRLHAASTSIEVTAYHPFWVVEGASLDSRPVAEHVPDPPADSRVPGRWVDAIDVRSGDVLLLRDGRRPVV